MRKAFLGFCKSARKASQKVQTACYRMVGKARRHAKNSIKKVQSAITKARSHRSEKPRKDSIMANGEMCFTMLGPRGVGKTSMLVSMYDTIQDELAGTELQLGQGIRRTRF